VEELAEGLGALNLEGYASFRDKAKKVGPPWERLEQLLHLTTRLLPLSSSTLITTGSVLKDEDHGGELVKHELYSCKESQFVTRVLFFTFFLNSTFFLGLVGAPSPQQYGPAAHHEILTGFRYYLVNLLRNSPIVL
jgi:hypothetical protein